MTPARMSSRPLISIHALLAESDHPSLSDIEQHTYFYPRSPCGERPKQPKHQTQTQYFYPRSPCGERRVFNLFANPGSTISIHALLAESDADALTDDVSTGGFLSTLSLRRATRYFTYYIGRFLISIHALLAESDCTMTITICTASNFYPRSPCGERQVGQKRLRQKLAISIHALLAESDHFDNYNLHCVDISIHALLAESDPPGLLHSLGGVISIHALLAESDLPTDGLFFFYQTISIHALLAESDRSTS